MSAYTAEGELWISIDPATVLGRPVSLYVKRERNDSVTQRQQQIVESLSQLPESVEQKVFNCAFQHYQNFLDSTGDVTDPKVTVNSIKNHCHLSAALVPEIFDSDVNFVFLNFDCDWEEEHGMQVLLRNGDVLWCGTPSSLPFSSQWKKLVSMSPKDSDAAIKHYLKELSK